MLLSGNPATSPTPLPYPVEMVRSRYNRLAAIYEIFEVLFWLPAGIRLRAVRTLDLDEGQSVLEVGCGTGRNLPYLQAAVGAGGRIFGVDLSEAMLARCQALCERRAWRNVWVTRQDALSYRAPEPVDAILFSLSYATMQYGVQILHQVWDQLKPGGRLVILDGKNVSGVVGRILRPWILFWMKSTVLGDPDTEAWRHLQKLTPEVEVWEELLGAYYIARARKPAAAEGSRLDTRLTGLTA